MYDEQKAEEFRAAQMRSPKSSHSADREKGEPSPGKPTSKHSLRADSERKAFAENFLPPPSVR